MSIDHLMLGRSEEIEPCKLSGSLFVTSPIRTGMFFLETAMARLATAAKSASKERIIDTIVSVSPLLFLLELNIGEALTVFGWESPVT